MTTIGDRVRQLRTSKGLSQQALTGDGISAGYVSLIESGKRTPSPEVAAKLAERLGVELSALVGEQDSRRDLRPARLGRELRPGAGERQHPPRRSGSRATPRSMAPGHLTANDAALALAEASADRRARRRRRVLRALVAALPPRARLGGPGRAATTLAVMLIESGDVARSVEIARALPPRGRGRRPPRHRRAPAARARSWCPRSTSAATCSVATHHIEALILAADRMSSSPRPRRRLLDRRHRRRGARPRRRRHPPHRPRRGPVRGGGPQP